MPGFIEKQFIGTPDEVIEDKYAHLFQGATERQASIAGESAGYNREMRASVEQPWLKTANAPVTYTQPQMPRNLVDIDRAASQDVSERSIRRSMYDVDSQSNEAAPRDITFVTEQDAMNVLLRGASIWDPHAEEMQDYCREVMAEDMWKSERAVRDAKRDVRHQEWEKGHADRLRPYTRSARQNQVTNIRTSVENVVAGRNDMWDYDAVEKNQTLRDSMRQNKLDLRDSISRKDNRSREQRHASWEEDVTARVRAPRQQDHVGQWLEDIMGQLENEG